MSEQRSTDFAPGQVAMVTPRAGGITATAPERLCIRGRRDGIASAVFVWWSGDGYIPDHDVAGVRLVVTLVPEDADSPLYDALRDIDALPDHLDASTIRAKISQALHRLAGPPIMEEPQEFGARVTATLDTLDSSDDPFGAAEWIRGDGGVWVCLTNDHVGVKASWHRLAKTATLSAEESPKAETPPERVVVSDVWTTDDVVQYTRNGVVLTRKHSGLWYPNDGSHQQSQAEVSTWISNGFVRVLRQQSTGIGC